MTRNLPRGLRPARATRTAESRLWEGAARGKQRAESPSMGSCRKGLSARCLRGRRAKTVTRDFIAVVAPRRASAKPGLARALRQAKTAQMTSLASHRKRGALGEPKM